MKDRGTQFSQVFGNINQFWLCSRGAKKNYPLQRGRHPQPRFSLDSRSLRNLSEGKKKETLWERIWFEFTWLLQPMLQWLRIKSPNSLFILYMFYKATWRAKKKQHVDIYYFFYLGVLFITEYFILRIVLPAKLPKSDALYMQI